MRAPDLLATVGVGAFAVICCAGLPAVLALVAVASKAGRVNVEVLYFDGCPNHEELLPRLRELMRRAGVPAEIELREITDDEAAQRERFLGSPTVRVDGRDVEPDADRRTDFGVKCRLYRDADGLSGQPADAWILARLQAGEPAGDRVEKVAQRVTAAMPALGSSEQTIALALLRQLAHGAPVSVSRLAAVAELPEAQITDALDRLPGVFRDDQQLIVGFMGLTVIEMGQHRMHLDGRAFSAWCAWDTLFLPELLGETVSVTSSSPASGAEIALAVTPTGPADVRPEDTVVSFLLPETDFDADVIQRFCHFVHFFASPAEGETWTREHPGTFLLSVDDAYRLGQLTNHAIFGAALAPAGR